MPERSFSGGCFCGAVRYEARGAPSGVGNCHCTDCRRASGAPFVTYATFPRDKIVYTKGEPTMFQSSEAASRGFCAVCGGQLLWRRNEDDGTIDLTVGTMDDPDALPPASHGFMRSRVKWLRLDDGLPQYETWGPT